MIIKGHVWKFDNDINTDLILPNEVIFLPSHEWPKHMFRANRPGWANQVNPGDILIAGSNFGTGSGRPGAKVMKDLGLGCLLAESINGLFYRNCVNYAFPALEVTGVINEFKEGDFAEIDFENATVKNINTGKILQGKKWPKMLIEILKANGIYSLLEAEELLLPS